MTGISCTLWLIPLLSSLSLFHLLLSRTLVLQPSHTTTYFTSTTLSTPVNLNSLAPLPTSIELARLDLDARARVARV